MLVVAMVVLVKLVGEKTLTIDLNTVENSMKEMPMPTLIGRL